MAVNSSVVGVDQWSYGGAGGVDVVGGPWGDVTERVFNWIILG
jgi:hypothetical protein